nr:hypothetical protein [Vibrio parahaemolyticus]
MATTFAHTKLTQLTAALAIAFSATTTAGVIGEGQSESFNLKFEGTISRPAEHWNFSIPADTIQKVSKITADTAKAVDDTSWYVWNDIVEKVDLLYGSVEGAGAKKAGFDPEIQLQNEVIEPGKMKEVVLVAKNQSGANIGNLELKSVRHWATGVYTNEKDTSAAGVGLKFADGVHMEHVGTTDGVGEMKDKFIMQLEEAENIVGIGNVDTHFEHDDPQLIVAGSDRFNYHGQRLITFDSATLKLNKNDKSDSWAADLSMTVTLK